MTTTTAATPTIIRRIRTPATTTAQTADIITITTTRPRRATDAHSRSRLR